jgi:hypothetical protein
VEVSSRKNEAIAIGSRLIQCVGWNTGGAKSTFYNGQYLADAEDVIVVTIKFASQPFAQADN